MEYPAVATYSKTSWRYFKFLKLKMRKLVILNLDVFDNNYYHYYPNLIYISAFEKTFNWKMKCFRFCLDFVLNRLV